MTSTPQEAGAPQISADERDTWVPVEYEDCGGYGAFVEAEGHGWFEIESAEMARRYNHLLAALASREAEVRRQALREAATAVERRAGDFKNLASDKVRRQTHNDVAKFLRELSNRGPA